MKLEEIKNVIECIDEIVKEARGLTETAEKTSIDTLKNNYLIGETVKIYGRVKANNAKINVLELRIKSSILNQSDIVTTVVVEEMYRALHFIRVDVDNLKMFYKESIKNSKK